MIILTIIAAAITLGACGVAWRNWCALQAARTGWERCADRALSAYAQISATKAKQSRAGKIGRQAQIDRERALRDATTARLEAGA